MVTDDEAGWSAELIEWNRKRKARDYRRVPMPEFPAERRGPSWCRWCGDRILIEAGKKNAGQPNVRRTWHPECAMEFNEHSNLSAMYAACVRRDGEKCVDCAEYKGYWARHSPSLFRGDDDERWGYRRWSRSDSPEGRMLAATGIGQYCHTYWSTHLEVDHDVPLWKVRDLPDDERRWYYGPRNLRLRCPEHHKAKSKREAAERARERALDRAQGTLPL